MNTNNQYRDRNGRTALGNRFRAVAEGIFVVLSTLALISAFWIITP